MQFDSPEDGSLKITFVSLRKFLPMMNSSTSPFTEHSAKDFFDISGMPGGWAENKSENYISKTSSQNWVGIFFLSSN